jgi:hypothetical protein
VELKRKEMTKRIDPSYKKVTKRMRREVTMRCWVTLTVSKKAKKLLTMMMKAFKIQLTMNRLPSTLRKVKPNHTILNQRKKKKM